MVKNPTKYPRIEYGCRNSMSLEQEEDHKLWYKISYGLDWLCRIPIVIEYDHERVADRFVVRTDHLVGHKHVIGYCITLHGAFEDFEKRVRTLFPGDDSESTY